MFASLCRPIRPAYRRIALLVLFICAAFALKSPIVGSNASAETPTHGDRLEALQASLDRLEKEAADLRVQAVRISEEARQAQGRLNNLAGELRESIDQMEMEIGHLREIGDPFPTASVQDMDEIRGAVPARKASRAEKEDAIGWPWWIDVFLVVLLCVSLYLTFRHLLTPEAERRHEEDDDTGFTEENELGSIRYPGAVSSMPPSTEPDETKPPKSDDLL